MTERYAAAPRWRRSVTIAVVAVVAVAGLGWVAWAAYNEATPKVQSQLVTFHVGGEHSVSAQVDVRVSSGTTGASCTVQAVAEDHTDRRRAPLPARGRHQRGDGPHRPDRHVRRALGVHRQGSGPTPLTCAFVGLLR